MGIERQRARKIRRGIRERVSVGIRKPERVIYTDILSCIKRKRALSVERDERRSIIRCKKDFEIIADRSSHRAGSGHMDSVAGGYAPLD
jgi:hypothetical protein